MGRPRREIKRYARKLRRNQTPSERRMWGLIFLGFFAQRITPINYIADYYNPLSRIIVEVDGGVHLTQRGADRERDRRHRVRGVYTVRVSNNLIQRARWAAYLKIILLSLMWQFIRWFRL